ncbi:MAG: orotidine 5'-phosphate decarboxylase / HUMPS family protein, partial [Minisyncoccia bacterium]
GIIFIFLLITFKIINKFQLSFFKKHINELNYVINDKQFNNSTLKNQLIQSKDLLQNLNIYPNFKLEKNKKYLHIALNNNLSEAKKIISEIPFSDRILIEVGTPLIKIYGSKAISEIKKIVPFGTYIIADNKCADLAAREVQIMAKAGANAATCLGIAPIETINSFIEECQKNKINSIIDMMNVENALMLLKQLKKQPDIVILHRGVDETKFSKEKQIPYYQIKQIKGSYDILIAVAGGDTIQEIKRAILNDVDIVVLWEAFYKSNSNIKQLVNLFLQEIR